VSKAAKAANSAEIPFEDALGRLDGIVTAMEGGELPLEQLLQRYEEGTKLYRLWQERLAEAELKIAKLEAGAAGELTLKPLALDAAAAD
jgi:exodeoxyribonuclease VII small subunit